MEPAGPVADAPGELTNMANLKSLAKDTAIYGMSSILGRFLNYLLVPLYTATMAASSGDYGVITNVYSYTALLLVLLTFGMETTFFRFASKEGEDPMRVYSTTLLMVGGVGLVFVAAVLTFIGPVATWMEYPDHPEYVATMFTCVAIDAFQAIPFAYLRYRGKALKFAVLKLLFIVPDILLNLAYFVGVPWLYGHAATRPLVEGFYDGRLDFAWAFYINLFCTASVTFLFRRELTGFRYVFDRRLAARMWRYSWPILVLGIAGILNQVADKILFRFIAPHTGREVDVQLGIYGAAVKIAMIMTLITQAFRYAYEPFVFNKSRDSDSKATYALAMKYFLIFTLLAFLCVMGYLDVLKFIIAPGYWAGLKVTPVVMVAGILLGVYFNLSLWYKLIDRTVYGMWFSLAGCAVLIGVNVVFIPQYSYMACAWGGVAGYGTATLLSYFVGQRVYPIHYPLRSMGVYVLLAALFYGLMTCVPDAWPLWARLGVNTALIALFVAHTVHYDFPLSGLPVVGKWFKRLGCR